MGRLASASGAQVDVSKLATSIMDDLSAIQLEPRPHFRVLPPRKQQDEPNSGRLADETRSDTFWKTKT